MAGCATPYRRDGFELARAICPPTPRRGLMLIDPSYEVKADYDAIPGHIAAISRRWNVGIIALWYPILSGGSHAAMVQAILAASPGALRHEVRFPPVREGHRMIGSGLVVINPPFGLEDEAARLSAIYARLQPSA